MFDIGFMELLLVALIGLIVLGPERLPKAAYKLGLLIARIRRRFSQVQQALEREVRMQELHDKLQDPYATFMDEEPQTTTPRTPPADNSHTEDGRATDLAEPVPPVADTSAFASGSSATDKAAASAAHRSSVSKE